MKKFKIFESLLDLAVVVVLVLFGIYGFKTFLDKTVPYEICHGFNCPEHDSIIHKINK